MEILLDKSHTAGKIRYFVLERFRSWGIWSYHRRAKEAQLHPEDTFRNSVLTWLSFLYLISYLEPRCNFGSCSANPGRNSTSPRPKWGSSSQLCCIHSPCSRNPRRFAKGWSTRAMPSEVRKRGYRNPASSSGAPQ